MEHLGTLSDAGHPYYKFCTQRAAILLLPTAGQTMGRVVLEQDGEVYFTVPVEILSNTISVPHGGELAPRSVLGDPGV